jgi:hypothetical protein
MGNNPHVDGSILPFPAKPSGSKAGTTMQESTYSPLPEPQRLPDDAPNILVVLIDDAGPAMPECLGGDIHTPTLAERERRRRGLQSLPHHSDVFSNTLLAAMRSQPHLRGQWPDL